MIRECTTSVVTLFDIVIDREDSEKFYEWAGSPDVPEVHLKRSGPAPIKGERGRFHADKLLLSGYLDGELSHIEVLATLRAAGLTGETL